jgi:hypothetical protein
MDKEKRRMNHVKCRQRPRIKTTKNIRQMSDDVEK